MLTVDSGQWKDIKFLRMDYIKNYNFTMAMGHVDLSDQLRGSYKSIVNVILIGALLTKLIYIWCADLSTRSFGV